jgi:hypothetical protein
LIGYRVSQGKLRALIKAEKADWLDRAGKRTSAFREQGRYEEKRSIWSEVKTVYMRLQGDCKCAYCERKLESVDYGKGEQDVEHFRPKKRVKAWKVPKALSDQGISFSQVPDDDRGYFLLPYHIFNYCAACIPCNRALKRDYFPIAGDYTLEGESPQSLTKERPYLIYPIGDFDVDPEDLITFYGTSPRAVAASGHRRSRALTTIEFFKLDDVNKRKNLIQDRAMVIVAMYPQLEKRGKAGEDSAKAARLVEGFTNPNSRHTNCARSFRRLFELDPVEAKSVYETAGRLIESAS